MFVFFSDGILDAANKKGEMFGRSGVEKIVGKCSTGGRLRGDSLFKAVAEYAAGVDTFDDQTVVAIKSQGQTGKEASESIRSRTCRTPAGLFLP